MNSEYSILLDAAPKERLKLLHGRKDLMLRLWAFEKEFSRTLEEAVLNAESANDHYLKLASQYFIDTTIAAFISKPSDMVSVIAAFHEQNTAKKFLGICVRHPLLNVDILSGLGSDKDIFRRLPFDISWAEVPITAYAKMLLQGNPGRSFEADDLLPLGTDINPGAAEYVLAWAYEENRLTDAGIDVFRNTFPKKYGHLKKIIEKNN